MDRLLGQNISILQQAFIVIFMLISIANALDSKDIFTRNLASGSSFSSCSEGNTEDGGSYLDDTCISDPGKAIRMIYYNSGTEYVHCNNAVSSGIIFLEDVKGESLDLYALSTASASSHNLGEWNIAPNMDKTTEIIISRDSGNYEDVYIYIFSQEGIQYFSSKDLSSCSSDKVVLSIKEAKSVRIRFKILNDASDYHVTIKSAGDGSGIDAIFIIFLVLGITFVCVVVILILIYFVYALYHQKPEQTPDQIANEIIKQRREFIQKVIGAMSQGKYEEFQFRHNETSCIICQSDFELEDQVGVTIECTHAFHVVCLEKWYDTIRISRQLKCPHCNEVTESVERKAIYQEEGNLEVSSEFEGDNIELPGYNETAITTMRFAQGPI